MTSTSYDTNSLNLTMTEIENLSAEDYSFFLGHGDSFIDEDDEDYSLFIDDMMESEEDVLRLLLDDNTF